MREINFSENWNNKLNCTAFTTIRKAREKYYQLNHSYQINLNRKRIGKARLIKIRIITLHTVNEYVSRLDTGLSTDEFRKLMIELYPDTDWDNQLLYLLLFVNESKPNQTELWHESQLNITESATISRRSIRQLQPN